MQSLFRNATFCRMGRRRCRVPSFEGCHAIALAEEFRASAALTYHRFSSMVDQFETKFAVVDHSSAYEAAMNGPHGRQLALAKLEGKGRDDKPFDPFREMERRKKAESNELEEAEETNQDDEEADEDADDEGDDDEEGETRRVMPSIYNRDGSLRRKKSQLATLRAGYPAGGLFAVVHVNGFQHKVAPNDILVVDRLKPLDTWKIGSTHTLTEVLLVASTHLTLVGMPLVSGAQVDVMVEEITRDAKVISFKKRRRKNSKRKKGFRRDVTVLRILDVRMPEPYVDHKHIEPEIELLPGRGKVKDGPLRSTS